MSDLAAIVEEERDRLTRTVKALNALARQVGLSKQLTKEELAGSLVGSLDSLTGFAERAQAELALLFARNDVRAEQMVMVHDRLRAIERAFDMAIDSGVLAMFEEQRDRLAALKEKAMRGHHDV